MVTSVIRAFIAIDLPPEIQGRLEQVILQLQQSLQGVPVRWVPAENIHLTLMFLGDVSLSNLQLLKDNLQSEVGPHHPFEISVGGLGAYPSTSRPRVLWIGVEAPPDLGVIQTGIEHKMERLGYTRDERSFSPHLTLGRISRNTSPSELHKISEVLQTTRVGFLGAVRVQGVHLYRSDLKPNGAVYTRIYSVPLLDKPMTEEKKPS